MARILVIDDVRDVRSLVRQILADSGHEILVAEDAMEGMEFLNSYRVDLLILDIELPYTNGIQFSETLRGSLRYKFLPIIFLTARREKRDIDRALHVQAENYLLKPIDRNRLMAAVTQVLEKTKPREPDRVQVSQSTLAERADVLRRIPATLISISEIGFLVRSPCSYGNEEMVQLDTSFFEQAGIPNLPLKVGVQRRMDGKHWEITLLFCNLNQDHMTKIRTWVLSQSRFKAG